MQFLSGFFQEGIPAIEIVIGTKPIVAFIDTGFNAQLVLPRSVIRRTKMETGPFADYVTSSGENVISMTFFGRIQWFGQEKEVIVIPGPEGPGLIGMGLLHDCDVFVA